LDIAHAQQVLVNGTPLWAMEHALRFSVVSQQVAFTARQFVHSGILLRYIKKEFG
jgi:hypothetical protein